MVREAVARDVRGDQPDCPRSTFLIRRPKSVTVHSHGVETRALKQAVRRALPAGFSLRTIQRRVGFSKITNCDLRERPGYSKYPPFAFTEQGVAREGIEWEGAFMIVGAIAGG